MGTPMIHFPMGNGFSLKTVRRFETGGDRMSAKERAVVEPYALNDALERGLRDNRVLYLTAPVGYGKTTAVRHHFRSRPHTWASLWDEDALDRAEQDNTGLVILDDCHLLIDQPELQPRLCALLRGLPAEGRVVLLSRAPLPDCLLPFQLSGLLTVIESGAFVLGTEDIAHLVRAVGIDLPQEDILRLGRESQGYPLLTRLICLELAEGRPLNTETVQRATARAFHYLDGELFAYWDSKSRRLLLSASFFDCFTLELAQILTGDSRVEQTLNHLLQISSLIDKTGDAYAIRYPRYRAYLQHKAETTWSRQEVDALYANAGVYFQLRGDLPAALDCYAKNGNRTKVSELLVEHSKQHPGHGVYYQLRKYYRSLSEGEILSSPELMSGMSVLCSLTFEVEESERWYAALKDYAAGLGRRAPNYRAVQGLVDYLNIALPHRGSVHIRDILMAAYDRLARGDIQLPEFCVTSNMPSILRGGKDFSAWVPRDKLLYATLSKPVETLLGRLGVGLPDIAITESRYEKGEDVSDAFLTLASRRADIQRKGAPEMEFVLTALLAWCQCDLGKADQAVQDVTAFRARMEGAGQKQLLPNLDALLCRFALLTGGEYVHRWFTEEAPDESDFFIMERYRYFTKIQCYLQRGDCLATLALLGRLLDHFDKYDRTLDKIEALALLAVCRYRMEADDWREHLNAALELAKKYGYVRVFAHLGAALLPLLRAWAPPEKWTKPEQSSYLARVQKGVSAFAALYPDYLAPAGAVSIQSLTRKELEVLRLMCLGKSGGEIREILAISDNTLKTHSRRLFQKLGVNSRAEAVAAAQKLHLI